ncbi:MAG: endopolygalacturonase, partial [Deltaproteobacteria bacterium]|nr:endopolygalacturonase [Deltaproteobacteria bacterium]
TKALPAAGPLIPNFHDIFISNLSIAGATNVKLQGFAANTEGLANPAYPLVISLENVVTHDPESLAVISSDADITLRGVNLPVLPSAEARVVVNGKATHAIDPDKIVDCRHAYVDFPTLTSPNGTTW